MWQCHYSLFINSHVRARFPADNNVSTIAQILIKYECAPGSALLGEPSWLAGSIDPRGPRGVRLIYGSLIESFAGWEKQVGTCERSWRGQNRYGNWLARTNYSLCPMFSLFFISLFVLYHFFLSPRPPAWQAFIGCSSAFNWISDKEWRAEQPHNDCHVFRSFSSDSARYCPHGKVIDVGLWIPGEGPEAVHGRLRKHSQHE